MGRAFEYRKARKLKRWGNMSRTFTRLGKELTIAAKQGGTDPENNPRLRALIQTARSENMPKDNIERAIKRAEEKDKGDYREVVYEGFGPHGVAIIVETATDNTTRTVANIRSYFNKYGGNLGTSGSVSFMFDHTCVFKVKSEQVQDMETFELELIDYGAEEIFLDEEEGVIVIYGSFESYGSLQKFIEEKELELVSGGFDRIVNGELKHLSTEEKTDVEKLLERIEEDDDVQNVYTNMA
ncbi:MAG TPA: YebC/PmpR family DNA-binding transcriptional regulator [Bacteroidales bacterium]|nr:YebC/PmpR family DNA-binding transcriptional regulator [Bacteroidales bacterium]OQB68558.1 MAG: putative transcriptional regulatory protein [Bacteroidetes bacterium ADurb.Bin139]HOG25958.1 YebC/PmpR family DNA-binding transcriptional regulator [Bacteroidales bacterium]HOR12062.1 YebC/PmpR family DNA-binding transcriptional regulator [Bacteroidales bacterium]HPK38880.1 YebC/PmpR family DNA-binding transcriptional regulator [Bacteroidales bacterium]